MEVTSYATAADEPLVGRWLADHGQGIQVVIELSIQDGAMFGRVVSVTSQGSSINPTCDKCQGDLRGAGLVGAIFIRDLRKDDNQWVDGKVVDIRPGFTQGISANCEIKMEGSRARIFGYLGFRWLGQADYWVRANVP